MLPFTWLNLTALHPRILCAKFGWNLPCESGEEDENVKSLQTDRWTTDNRQSEKLTWAFSSGEAKSTFQKALHHLKKKVYAYLKFQPMSLPSGIKHPHPDEDPCPWNVLQSPLGIFHIHVSPSCVPTIKTWAIWCHCSHWIKQFKRL